jgi:hypothetical protein
MVPENENGARDRHGLRYPCPREGGRADEGGGLENRLRGDSYVGSNPTPPALPQVVTAPGAANQRPRTVVGQSSSGRLGEAVGWNKGTTGRQPARSTSTSEGGVMSVVRVRRGRGARSS